MGTEHIFDRRRRLAATLADRILSGIYRLAAGLGLVHHEAPDLTSVRPERILVIQLDRIGDTVMSTPVYAALKSAYPESHVTALVRPLSRDLLRHNPHVDECLFHSPPWWSGARGLAKIGAYLRYLPDYLRLVRRLRSRRFDLAIELRGDLRHILLYTTLGNCRYRVGYERAGGADLLTHPIPFDSQLHVVESNLRLLEPLGIEVEAPALEVWVGEEDEAALVDRLRNLRISRRQQLIVVHPGGRISTKLWPANRFVQVIDRLAEADGAPVVLIGGPEERALCEEIAAQSSRAAPVVLAGQLSLGELAALLKRANLFLGGDSGPQHLAAAVGTPAVVLFGPTDPAIYGPWSGQAAVLSAPLPCRPCFHPACPASGEEGSACMEAIEVEDVYVAIQQLQAGGSELEHRQSEGGE